MKAILILIAQFILKMLIHGLFIGAIVNLAFSQHDILASLFGMLYMGLYETYLLIQKF